MEHLHLFDGIESHELMPGFHGKFVHTEGMTLVLWEIEAGAKLPEHSHPQEQVTLMLSGAFEMTIDGNTCTCKAGGMLTIPSNAVHSGKALSPVTLFDVFRPGRDDFPGK
ncbi:MAG: cupin domain-containing protein [Bacteroidetes bacterium]|nr:cupin domain-containing protein [Bacteroidota bacterium]